VLPAVALLVGERFWRLSFPNEDAAIRRSWPLLITAIASLLLAVSTVIYSARTARLPMNYALVIALVLFFAGCLPFVLRRSAAIPIACFGIATLLVLIVGLNWAPRFTEKDSARRLLQLADARGYANAPLYGLQRDDRSPEFYAAGRIVYEPDGEPVMYEGLGQIVSESRGETLRS
jgi:hypothetical protein